jgi:hypothetical protein
MSNYEGGMNVNALRKRYSEAYGHELDFGEYECQSADEFVRLLPSKKQAIHQSLGSLNFLALQKRKSID